MKNIIFISFIITISLFARNHQVKEIKNCILFYDEGYNAVNLKFVWYSHREYYGKEDYLNLEFQTKLSVDFKVR
jgi:hypothetical protein